MKLIKLNEFLTSVKLGKIAFNEAEKTFTQAQLDEIIKQKAEESFKAGQAKAKETAEQAKMTEELKALKAEKAQREQTEAFGKLKENLNTDEFKGLSAKGLFAKTYQDRLNGKNGNDLKQEIQTIKTELEKSDEEQHGVFFGSTEVNANSSLIKAGTSDKDATKNVEYYPGTTIKK